MKPVAIFRHLAAEGPGYSATYTQRDLPRRLVGIDDGEVAPGDPLESGDEFTSVESFQWRDFFRTRGLKAVADRVYVRRGACLRHG